MALLVILFCGTLAPAPSRRADRSIMKADDV